ncbi:D-tyrosyl-tRNA(Tyr) deacylase [Ereboglobus sp. PH5-5]|uniref:D-aminoacyl-tRNA deacylase n=1 Tax=unclassified Ereboglobus TaxID=2626932 RepID=UPI0024068E69|nr:MULTISPECIES: D-aminoacyl-tRNA deacylase [unclassified Ereboglobus]MDF9826938.1 D-tyrosyl-tRNA(Tyr) deacylase [Ereboglobus sp. PH5-10]MDF9831959.1 D-tyrosyl-tRNA(Tyr) deacylase [Ereboglobus sp. PH5-5]
MRAVVQRVTSASVTIDGEVRGEIGAGLVILLGIAEGDTVDDVCWLAEKCAALRIFSDDANAMNRSLVDTGGGALVISQFTLIASCRKGSRPSFHRAAKPAGARPLYEQFLAHLSAVLGRPVACGEFGAMMQVALVNDGPVTIVVDSRE